MLHNVRLLTAWLLGLVCLLPALCCRPEEYAAQDGQCCPMCREGTVVTKHCTVDSGTRCGACASGTYMNQPNGGTQCFLCSICPSAHGLFAQPPCSSVSDAVCSARPGFFCERISEGGSCEAAQKHSSCSPGQTVREPGTSSADTVCEDCPEETFSPQGSNCTAWTRCSEAEIVIRAGNRTEDVLCGRVLQNHHYGIIPSFLFIVICPVILVVVHRFRRQSDLQESHGDQSVPL